MQISLVSDTGQISDGTLPTDRLGDLVVVVRTFGGHADAPGADGASSTGW